MPSKGTPLRCQNPGLAFLTPDTSQYENWAGGRPATASGHMLAEGGEGGVCVLETRFSCHVDWL